MQVTARSVATNVPPSFFQFQVLADATPAAQEFNDTTGTSFLALLDIDEQNWFRIFQNISSNAQTAVVDVQAQQVIALMLYGVPASSSALLSITTPSLVHPALQQSSPPFAPFGHCAPTLCSFPPLSPTPVLDRGIPFGRVAERGAHKFGFLVSNKTSTPSQPLVMFAFNTTGMFAFAHYPLGTPSITARLDLSGNTRHATIGQQQQLQAVLVTPPPTQASSTRFSGQRTDAASIVSLTPSSQPPAST